VPSPIRRFAIVIAASALAVFPAHGQTAAHAVGPIAAPKVARFHGRSWRDYWLAREAAAKAAEPDARTMIHRMSTPASQFHPDSGNLGLESAGPYFSGSDTSLGYSNFEIFAGLQRQTNCSISQTVIAQSRTAFTFSGVQTIPNFDKYLHTISGISSTGGKFPDGCDDPTITGQPQMVVNGGKTSSGSYVGAYFTYHSTNAITVTVLKPDFSSYTNTDVIASYGIGGILSADFNGDGYLDFAVIGAATTSYPSTGQISVLIAKGDGTYKAALQLPADAAAFGAVAGDFNGDKKADLLVTAQKSNGDYELLFFAGNGDGTFKAAVSTDTGTTEHLVSLPVDINKDGKLDVIAWDLPAGDYATGTLDSLINNGSAVFTPTPSATAASYNPVAVGDLNNDGKLDLIYTSFADNSIVVLEGNGAGSFTQKNVYPTYNAPSSVYITDFDGDGNADFLLGFAGQGFFGPGEEGSGELLLGNGDFTFSTPAQLPELVNGGKFSDGPRAMAVADLNGDSKQDLAVLNVTAGQNPTATISTYVNNGTTALSDGTVVNFTLGEPYAPTPDEPLGTMLAVPLSGTTPVDLLVSGTDPGTSAPAIQAAINNGSGTFTVKPTIFDLPAPAASFVAADFNADGKNDLALVLNDQNTDAVDGLYIALGNGDGTFKTPALLSSDVSQGGNVFTADVNNDGKPDLIVLPQNTSTFQTVAALIYVNKGAATFDSPITFNAPTGASFTWVIPADVNGDGKMDLTIIGTQNVFESYAFVYTGNNTGNFTLSGSYDLGANAASTGILVDVNQDGILDLVVDGCCGAASPSVALGKGAGAFYPPQVFITPQSVYGVLPINLTSSKYPDLIFSVTNDGYNNAFLPVVNNYVNAPSVSKAATSVTASNPGTLAQGEDGQILVTVAETSAGGVPTGTVTLSQGSNLLGTGILGGGQYYFGLDSTPYPPGTYTLTVNYLGDNFNSPSSTTVSVKVIYNTTLSFTVTPLAIPSGDNVTLQATVARSPGSGYPTGEVTFFYDGGNAELASAPLKNGVATLTASTAGYPAGLYQLVAAYFGDANDGDSSSPILPVTIVPKGLNGTTTALSYSPNPVTDGQTVSLSATVKKTSGSGVPTGNVKFYVFNQLVATEPLNGSGVAKISTPTSDYYPNNYPAYAVYSGNSTTYTSTSPVEYIFLRYQSTATVSATPSSVTPGQSVTLTANVYGGSYGYATGTVKFFADGVALATKTLNNGSATFTASTSGIPAGTYNVTAVYSGDQYNGAATSQPTTVTVQ
jgi:hypothetical protein